MKWCECKTVGMVARDSYSTCGSCRGIDAYKSDERRTAFEVDQVWRVGFVEYTITGVGVLKVLVSTGGDTERMEDKSTLLGGSKIRESDGRALCQHPELVYDGDFRCTACAISVPVEGYQITRAL